MSLSIRTIRVPFMLSLILILKIGVTCVADEAPAGLTEAEKRGGWKPLFDGQTTNGWRNYRAEKMGDGWAVKDGVLERVGNGAGDIVTTDEFENFELSLEYRISKGGNSGIMFHVTEDDERPWASGPEVQIQDNVDGHDPQKAGWLYQLYKPVKPAWATQFENQVGFKGIEMDDATRPAGEWNQVYPRISPRQCEVAVNGVSYYYFHLGTMNGTSEWRPASSPRFLSSAKRRKGTSVCRTMAIWSPFGISGSACCRKMAVCRIRSMASCR